MNFDLKLVYFCISSIYSVIGIAILLFKKDPLSDEILVTILSSLIGGFLGWLLFPILLFYNLFIRKTFI